MLGRTGAAGLSAGAQRLDPEDAALVTLLERHPDALVVAVGGEDTPTIAPMPAAIRLTGHTVADASRQLLDEIVAEDHAVIVRLWGQCRARGIALSSVRRADDPGSRLHVYMVDVRRRHGVIVAIVADGSAPADHEIVEASMLPALAPRFARSGKDAGAVFRWIDTAFTQILGWGAEDIVGRRAVEIIHPDDRAEGIASWMEMLEAPAQPRPVRLRHQHRDGSWVWLEITNHNRLDDPAHGDVLSEMVDITDEMAALDALHAREQLLAQLTETVPVGMFHVDLDGTLLFANRRLHDILGIHLGAGLDALLLCVAAADRASLRAALDAAAGGAESDVEVRVAGGARGERHCTVSIRPLYGETGTVTGVTGCVEDVTVTVRTLHELRAKASSDGLTGCLNRPAIVTALQELLDGLRPGGGTAVLFLDLDRFKPVNDRLGHAAGDELLLRVAQRIRASVRADDVVGRWGGDEFVVLCPGIASGSHALAVADSLARRVFGSHADGAAQPLEVRASVGVAWTDAAHARGRPRRAGRQGHVRVEAPGSRTARPPRGRAPLRAPAQPWRSLQRTPAGPTVAECTVPASMTSSSPACSSASPAARWKTIDPSMHRSVFL